MLLALLECLFHSLCIVIPDAFSIKILFHNMTVMFVLATFGMVAIYNR
jgi:hypothetical protein